MTPSERAGNSVAKNPCLKVLNLQPTHHYLDFYWIFADGINIQLTIEYHRFELHGSTYTQIFFFLINTVWYCKCIFSYDFLNIFVSLAYSFVRIHVVHVTYEISVNQLFTLLVRLPVSRRLLDKIFGASKLIHGF